MPKGPDGQKRPADTVGAAVKVARIATGEEVEDDKPAKGKAGGKARASALTPERRKQIAEKAAKARWRQDQEAD